MTSMFGPNGQRVLALIAAIPGLSVDQVDQVTVAWKRGSPRGRARAWARLNRTADEGEWYRILAAASLARREALDTARQVHRADWEFWAAACDAAAAVAGERVGRHYDTLVAPFAAAVPDLVRLPATEDGDATVLAANPPAFSSRTPDTAHGPRNLCKGGDHDRGAPIHRLHRRGNSHLQREG